MIMPRRASLTIACAVVLLAGAGALSAPPQLDNTTIRVKWNAFEQLLNRTPDTVLVQPKTPPPVPAVASTARVNIELGDALVTATADIAYDVLAVDTWVSLRLFDEGASVILTGVQAASGEYVQATGGGLTLVARATGSSGGHRTLRICWTAPTSGSGGMRTATLPLPGATHVALGIDVPPRYGEVAATGATLLSESPGHNNYAVTENGGEVGLSYALPASRTTDTAGSEAAPPRETQRARIAAETQTVVCAFTERTLSITAVRIDVAHTRIRDLTLRLPARYTMLECMGAGISQRRIEGDSLLRVRLAFECTGEYAMVLTGESSGDSVVTIPVLAVVEAQRQTGRFALLTDAHTDARLASMDEGVLIATSSFVNDAWPQLRSAAERAKLSLDAVTAAGEYFRPSLSAVYTLHRYATTSVVAAIADEAIVTSAVSLDRQVITQAVFTVRHRDAQFVTLVLPDSAQVWSATVDGSSVTPFMDSVGIYRIPMLRFAKAGVDVQQCVIGITYYQPSSVFRGRRTALRAPMPGMPVGQLRWTVYYPGQWRTRVVPGDFGESETRLSRGEFRAKYSELQSSNQQRQSGGGSAPLVLPDSPRQVSVRKILVLNEAPVLDIRFSSSSGAFLRWAVWPPLVLVAFGGGLLVARRGVSGSVRAGSSLARRDQ